MLTSVLARKPEVQHRFNSLMSERDGKGRVSQSLWMEMCLDIEGSVAAADQRQQVISSQPEDLRIKLRNETLMPGCECLRMLTFFVWADRDWRKN